MFSAAGAAMLTFVLPIHPIFSCFRLVMVMTGLCLATQAEATAPSPLALSCLACHQSAVNSPEMPSLLLLSPAAIDASLKATRDQPKSGSIMARFTAKMSDADIAQLAAELGKSAGGKP
jgi:cytochrome c553